MSSGGVAVGIGVIFVGGGGAVDAGGIFGDGGVFVGGGVVVDGSVNVFLSTLALGGGSRIRLFDFG